MKYDKNRHVWLVGTIIIARVDASRYKVTSAEPCEAAYASTLPQAQTIAELWQLRGRI